jgi:DNA-binding MarR family transcriptional regulator
MSSTFSTDKKEIDPADVLAAAAYASAFRAVAARMDAKLRALDVTTKQYQLMLALEGAADGSAALTVGGVAAALQVAQSSATELVRRAEDRGLVERVPDPSDRRSAVVRLTSFGRGVFAECFANVSVERAELIDAMLELASAFGRS